MFVLPEGVSHRQVCAYMMYVWFVLFHSWSMGLVHKMDCDKGIGMVQKAVRASMYFCIVSSML